MSAKTKVDGAWQNVVAPYIKVSGIWKGAKSALIKIDGEWKSWFLQGGVLDQQFLTKTGLGASEFADSRVFNVAVQPDGKMVVVGAFRTFNGTTVNGIVRLNADGTRDTAFTANTGTGFLGGGTVNSARRIVIQPDGKILLVGGGSWQGSFAPYTLRLNADGTRDFSLAETSFNQVTACVDVQADGKIVIGGEFTSLNGTPVNRIVRLNSDGTIDTAFVSNIGTGATSPFVNRVTGLQVQPDGKIVIIGSFQQFNGTTVNGIARLNADGTRDTAFTANTGTGFTGGGSQLSVRLQADGKIIILGGFTFFNGTVNRRILRLNADGTRDTAFMNNMGTGFSLDFTADAETQPDGKIVVVGNFTSVGGTPANGIARLNSDGTIDTAFVSNIGTGASTGLLYVVSDQNLGLIVSGRAATFKGQTINGIARIGAEIAY
jgi:uncharacterized delta-60 repeat protein